MRTMSLSNKPDTDPMELVNRACELNSNPIKLSWHNVFFEVDAPIQAEEIALDPSLKGQKTKRQVLLKSVTGFAPPGQATFIIGSTGAGKTTLLNTIADRVFLKPSDKISGNILFNDTIPVKKEIFGRFGAYVQSDDALFAWFTAREALTFSARLKLKVPDEEQDKLVEKIIFDLGLTMVAGN